MTWPCAEKPFQAGLMARFAWRTREIDSDHVTPVIPDTPVFSAVRVPTWPYGGLIALTMGQLG
jgi:hypothetical protein